MNLSKQTVRLYWQQIRHFKPSFFTALIVIPLASIVISSLIPYLLSQSIGKMTTGNIVEAQQYFYYTIAAGVVGFITNFVGFRALTIHESQIVTRLRNATFYELLHKDMRFYTNEKIGALTSKYIDYVRSETAIQDLAIIRTLGFTLSLLVGIGIVAVKSPLLAALLVGLIVVLILQVKWSLKKRQYWRNLRRELRSEIHGHVADALTNQLVVKTFTGEAREYKHLSTLGNKFTHAFMKDIGFVMTEGSIRVLLSITVQVAALGISISLLSQGKIDMATVIFSVSFLQLVGSNLFSLGEMLNGYQEALLEAQPMTRMLLEKNRVHDRTDAQHITEVTPTIDFHNVSYRYEDNKEDVLHHINLHIPAGQKVGLVGHSGAGKTTISHLLLRFADVTEGSITLDGHDLRDFTQQNLRQHIAFVPQEPMLFHRTLKENIAYGKPGASEEEIMRATTQANAMEFIKELPDGINTLVGERGVKLSGGQRQRIAIARALLKDAPVLLLDEATSALDSESEKQIQDALSDLMQGRTSVVIAHRLSTIAKLDRILVIDKGSIVEDGTHAQLLAHNGIYAKLWKRQSGGFIEE